MSSSSSLPESGAAALIARVFLWIVAKRWLMVVFWAAVLPPAAFYAAKVGQDNSTDRLIVPSDPDFVGTREFQKIFGGGEYAVLLCESDAPLSQPVVARLDKIENELKKIERLEASSALSTFRRAKGGFEPTPEQVEAFRKFATGSETFKKQGFVGDKFLTIALLMDVKGYDDRAVMLDKVERAIAAGGGSGAPLLGIRRVGQPYVNVLLDGTARRDGPKYFGLFFAFVVVLCLSLYRSARTLVAFLATLAVCLAVSVGYIGLTGGTFTLVSPMVPMTILVTATATLVYVHSRFVDRPEGRPVDEHQIFALTNKFVACTASIVATAVGFAALAVSKIRPIREMGVWVAVGLVLTFFICFTLFPALQKILKTPTGAEKKVAAAWFIRLTTWLPVWTYRFRYALVVGSLALCGAGYVALFGIPGVVSRVELLTNAKEYIPRDNDVYRDMKRLAEVVPGLSITEVWITTKEKGVSVSDVEVLNALDKFERSFDGDRDVGAAIGPATLLRTIRYLSGQSDAWPKDAAEVDELGRTLEGLVGQDPTIQRFVNKSLTQTHVALITRATEHDAFVRLDKNIQARWREANERDPVLKKFEMKTVGIGRLEAKMAQSLVPTLVESFVLTVAIIFSVFLVVFRSGAARVMTMIPSFFAILVMFLVMRLAGMPLNVATILIATTVLGTSENDQIHFFYHFLEKRKDGTVEESLRHTMLISGKAIFFATLINASGFLAFAFADLPPMRQFGVLTAVALVMSMVADFTALPAALWIIFREKPDALKKAG